jgi:hypothetical protein
MSDMNAVTAAETPVRPPAPAGAASPQPRRRRLARPAAQQDLLVALVLIVLVC